MATTSMGSDDLELLRQLAKGNEAAFESLYERYQGPIYRFALHMSGNAASAEEITQEVFMTVIRKPKSYDPAKGTVAGYLFGIARNLMRRTIQQRCHDVPLLEDGAEEDAPEAANIDPLEEISQAESLECLHKAVLALPQAYREVVVLCELEEMTYPEAAAVLKCSPGTIASRLHRAKSMLRSKLQGQGHPRKGLSGPNGSTTTPVARTDVASTIGSSVHRLIGLPEKRTGTSAGYLVDDSKKG